MITRVMTITIITITITIMSIISTSRIVRVIGMDGMTHHIEW